MQTTTSRLPPSAKVFAFCGIWPVALGTYLLFLRPVLMPEDPRYIGGLIETIQTAAPGLKRWIGHVFIVMGWFMLATGAMTVFVACRLLARQERGILLALSVAGAASVTLMSTTKLLLHSDFRWPLLLPASLGLAGLLYCLRERTASPTAAIGRLGAMGWGPGKRRYFRDQSFHFQTLRALNNIRTGSADTTEVLEHPSGSCQPLPRLIPTSQHILCGLKRC